MSNTAKHGMHGTRVYKIWCWMLDRCRNKRGIYGKKGISVCPRWESFQSFFEDMGAPPSRRHSIDRIDNDGDYEPGNCRWATRKQQARNTSRNTVLEWRGERRTIAGWSEVTGVRPATICKRLECGWSIDRALGEQVRPFYGPRKPWDEAGMSRSAWYRSRAAGGQ